MWRKLRARKTCENNSKTLVMTTIPWRAQVYCAPAEQQDCLTVHSQPRRLQLGWASMRGLRSKWMALKGNENSGSPSEDPRTTNWPTDLLLRISNCPLLKRLQKARSAPSICKTLQDKDYPFQGPHHWETLWVLTETAVWTTQLRMRITQCISDSSKGSAKIGFLITQGVGRALRSPRVPPPAEHTRDNLPLRTSESHDCDQVMAITTASKLTERKMIWLALM